MMRIKTRDKRERDKKEKRDDRPRRGPPDDNGDDGDKEDGDKKDRDKKDKKDKEDKEKKDKKDKDRKPKGSPDDDGDDKGDKDDDPDDEDDADDPFDSDDSDKVVASEAETAKALLEELKGMLSASAQGSIPCSALAGRVSSIGCSALCFEEIQVKLDLPRGLQNGETSVPAMHFTFDEAGAQDDTGSDTQLAGTST